MSGLTPERLAEIEMRGSAWITNRELGALIARVRELEAEVKTLTKQRDAAETAERWRRMYLASQSSMYAQKDRADAAEARVRELDSRLAANMQWKVDAAWERVEALEAALRGIEDDDAVMAGMEAVRKMLVMRVGNKHAHAEAFRDALAQAAATAEEGGQEQTVAPCTAHESRLVSGGASLGASPPSSAAATPGEEPKP